MKNLKKVMALVIVLSMVVSMFTVMTASAADFEDVIGTKYEEAVMILAPMGVIAGYNEGEAVLFKPEQVVTRAEMAAFIVRQLGLSTTAKAETKFSDVPKDFWGSGSINIANGKNIIVGYGDGTFGPDDQVSFEAAVKMIVCALGYEVDAKDNGGWPAGYIAIADKLGVLEDVEDKLADTTAGCDRGTVALLLYNALDTEIQDVTYYNGEVLSKVGSGKSMAYEMGYYKFADVMVEATDKAVISGGLQETGYANISGNSMLYGDNDMDAFLGQKVNLYASYNKKTDEYTIVSVVGTSAKSVVKVVDVADISDIDEDKNLNYYIDKASSSKTSSYRLATVPNERDLSKTDEELLTMVYNNNAIPEDDVDYSYIENATNGTVTLIDAEKNGIYEKVVIESYKNYQVADVDTEECILYLTDDTEITLDDSLEVNLPKFSIKNAEGAELTLADLAEDDVLSIYSDVYAEDKDYVADAVSLKIIACNETIEGVVTQKSSKKVYIDGEAYETDGVLSQDKFELEDEGVFFFDFNGDIAFLDTTSVLDSFEMLYAGTRYGAKITLSVIKSDGSKVSYDVASSGKVRVDGAAFDMDESAQRKELAEKLGISADGEDFEKTPYIVSLKTNDNNEITRIDTRKAIDSDRARYNKNDNLLGDYVLNANTVIFSTPKDSTNPEDMKVANLSSLRETNYSFEIYEQKDGFVTAMILITDTPDVDDKSDIAVIQSVSKVKNSDGDTVLSLTMIQGGKVVTKQTQTDYQYWIDDAMVSMYGDTAKVAYGAYPGQVIMYNEDSTGAVENSWRIYPRPSIKVEPAADYYLTDYFRSWNNTSEKYYDNAVCAITYGYVSGKDSDSKTLTLNSAVDEAVTDARAKDVIKISYAKARIVVVDTNLGSDELAVRTGSVGDIKNDSKILVRQKYGATTDIVVYKNFEAVPAYYK